MDQSVVVKDLYDSLERENDIRDQLKFAEEEAKNARKKVADLEEENENLNMQLGKMSAAKLSKPGTPDDDLKGWETTLTSYADVSSEREMQMKVELDLAQQEASGLRRKLSDFEMDKEDLLDKVKDLEKRLEDKAQYMASIPPPSPKSYYEDKIKEMKIELDEVRWKVIERDREIERLNATKRDTRHGSSGTRDGRWTPPLHRSKSLDSDAHVLELKRQIEHNKRESEEWRNKLESLERQNAELVLEHQRLLTQHSNEQQTQSEISDAYLYKETTELNSRVKTLVEEKRVLKTKLHNVVEALKSLTHDVASMNCRNCKVPQSSITWTKESFCRQISKESEELLKATEKELSIAKKRMSELENENARLARETQRTRDEAHSLSEQFDSKPDDEKSEDQMKSCIRDYKDEIQDMLLLLRTREDRNEELEAEVTSLRSRLDRLQDEWRKMELDLLSELEMSHQKNDVLSNLLEIVTERANDNEEEIYRLTNEKSSTRSASETSAVSVLSHTSAGSDNVFQGQSIGPSSDIIDKDWESQMKKRVTCLERLLAEERQKVVAAEKRLVLSNDDQVSSAMCDDVKLRMREKEILQTELATSQQQLIIAGDQIRGLTQRLSALEENNVKLMTDYASLETEVNTQGKSDSDDVTPLYDPDRLYLRTRVAELTRINDELLNENASLLEGKKQIVHDLDVYKNKTEELNYKVEEINEIWVSKSRASEKEKEELEVKVRELEDKLVKVTDLLQKVNLDAKQKSTLIAKTAQLMAEKDDVIKKREGIIKQQEDIMKQRDADFETLMGQLAQREKQMRELTEAVGSRDEKLREMDALVEKEVRKRLVDKDNEIKGLEMRLEQASVSDTARDSASLKVIVEQQKVTWEKLAKDRDRLCAELGSLRNEMIEKETNWKFEQSNVLTALKILKDKYGTLENMSTTTESEMLATLTESNAKLIVDKESLAGEMRKLQIRLDRANLEKNKMAEDSQYLGERMIEEVSRLKEQAQLSVKLQEEERVLRAEHVAMKAQYENRIEHLQHDYTVLRSAAEALHKERDLHQDIIRGIQRGMGQLKGKYTLDLAGWQQEKLQLERKLKELENSQTLLARMAEVTEDLNSKLYEESRQRMDLENKLGTQKTLFDMERAELHSRLNEMEEKFRCRGEVSSDLELVAAWQEERNEQKQLIAEAHRLSMDLQRQLKVRDESHSRERRDIAKKFDEEKRKLEAQKKELEKRVAAMDGQTYVAADLESKVADCESRLEADRHIWSREKKELQKRMADAHDALVKQNKKIDQILQLLRRLRELAAMVTDVGQRPGTSDCMDSAKIQKSLDQAVINYIREVHNYIRGIMSMVQLNAVTTDLSSYVDVTATLLPPLKRYGKWEVSASSTQVELYGPDAKPDPRLLQEPTKPPPVPRSADTSPTRGRDVTSRRHSAGMSPTHGRPPPALPASQAQSVGSRALHASRSVSPDLNRARSNLCAVRKITKYPDPPPSFIISPPPQSPQISQKPCSILTKSQYPTDPRPSISQPDDNASRQLTKSISFDTALLLSQRDTSVESVSPTHEPADLSSRSRRESSDEFGRARNRRVGQSLDRNVLFLSARTSGSLDRLSPRSARKKFFQEFHEFKTSIQDFSPWVRKKVGTKAPEQKSQKVQANKDSVADHYAVPCRNGQVFSSVHFSVHRDAVSPIPDVPWTERVNIVDNSGADIYEHVHPTVTASPPTEGTAATVDTISEEQPSKDKRKTLFKKSSTKHSLPSGFGSDLLAAVKRKLRPTHKKTLTPDDIHVDVPTAKCDDGAAAVAASNIAVTETQDVPDQTCLDGVDTWPLYEDVIPIRATSATQGAEAFANNQKPPAPPIRQPPRRWRSRSAERISPPLSGQGYMQEGGTSPTSDRIWQFNDTPV